MTPGAKSEKKKSTRRGKSRKHREPAKNSPLLEDKRTRTAEKTKTIEGEKESSFEVTRVWLKGFVAKHFMMTKEKKYVSYDIAELHALLKLVKKDLQQQPTLMELEPPLNVCGDIHGQLNDLRRVFHLFGMPGRTRFLFLGDYVDRGYHSLEVICLLFAFRLLWPLNMTLLRGNHELAHINKTYGFFDEISKRWPALPKETKALYDHFNDVFSYLPLAAVVGRKILCMHGGLSPRLKALSDIRMLPRPIVLPKDLAQDILWADPEHGVCGFKVNELRACSFNFGEEVHILWDVKSKCVELGISMVIRAHQVVDRGYSMFAGKRVLTVFSASRYQQDECNYAGIIGVGRNMDIKIIQFKPREYAEKKKKDEVTQDLQGDEEERKSYERILAAAAAVAAAGGAGGGPASSGSTSKAGPRENEKSRPRMDSKNKASPEPSR